MPTITKKIKLAVGERIDITAGISDIQIPELDVLTDNAEDRQVFEGLVKAGKATVKKGLQYGEIEVIVSNSGLDRYGEHILVEGIDTKQVMRNPVVLWAHQYSGLPIGQILKLWRSNGNLMARIKLDYDIYEFANIVYQMILRGTINAVSIGGLIIEFGEGEDGKTDYSVIAKLEMVELSVVPVGAHPDALVVGKTLGIKPEVVREQFEDFVQKSVLDKLNHLDDDEINNSINSLETILAALKATKDQKAQQDSPQKAKTRLIVLKRLGGEAQNEVNKLNRVIKLTLKGA